jgi:hypothetical protein
MKKILAGTIAAVALVGTVSIASAQTLPLPRLFNEPAVAPTSLAQDYEMNFGKYTTSPYANTGNSIGYNRNIADLQSVGG